MFLAVRSYHSPSDFGSSTVNYLRVRKMSEKRLVVRGSVQSRTQESRPLSEEKIRFRKAVINLIHTLMPPPSTTPSPSLPPPMATDLIESAPESAAPSIIINPRKRSPSWGSQPVEPAPLPVRGHHKSSLSNCSDVREIYNECLATHNSDQLCKTAVSYFSVCSSLGRE